MSSRARIMLAAMLIGLFSAGPAPAQEQDFSQVEIRTVPVAAGIYLLQGTGGNIGVLAGRDALIEFRDMLHTVAERLQGMLDDGMTTEDIIAARPTAEFDEKWRGGFLPPDRWVDLVLRGTR